MAVSFGEQIHALTGFDGDSASASEIGENYDDITAEWMNMSVREVVNILPPLLKEKCGTQTTLNASTPQIDLDGIGKILRVTRENADSGYQMPCRQIPADLAGLSEDPNSIHYASTTDPVYFITSIVSDAGTLIVKPTPTDTQTGIAYHVGYPVFDADGSGSNVNIKTATSIANFPDEAEYLVVLRAAIFASEYKLAIEEDVELYAPILATIKAQYQEGVLALQTGSTIPQQRGGKQ